MNKGFLGRVVIDASGIKAVVSEAKKRNITLAGAKAAGKILQVAARGAAPKRKGSGALKAAQGVKAVKGKKGTTTSFAVQGAKKKYVRVVTFKGRTQPTKVVPANYDHLVQLGTKPHTLNKGATLGRKGKADAKQTGGKHSGAKKNPYRQRAWEAVKGRAGAAAVEAMGKATQKEIDRQAAKIAAKAKGK